MNISTPSAHHIPALRRLWAEAFGDSEEFLDTFFSTAFHPKRCRIALKDDTPVASLYWFDCSMQNQAYAYLYAIATDSSMRHRGICHKLMEDTHRILASLGYNGVILVPGSPALFDFYKTLGFETTCFIKEFSCEAATHKIPVKRISKEEFKNLRRIYLPTQGILQEGANLDFLEKQASFYAGENFLLTARVEKGTLLGLELLGDASVAPALVHSLGFQKGVFHTPGEENPFAMYYSLADSDGTSPAYFGFAFD